MTRHVLALVALCWSVLMACAILLSLGVLTSVGLWAHLIPAGLMYSAADALGMRPSAHGLLVRSAHGPPLLGPVGVVLWYVLPTMALGVLAIRKRGRAPRPT